MMQTLAKIGFHQSYTYFTWRNTKDEITEYLAEVSGEQGAWMRPSFWPTTHDILPPYLQATGVRGFAVRAVLAALGAPTWGIYSGYELVEDVPRPGVDEQIDNEKYEFKPRDWAKADAIGINLLLGRLNELRHAHPALRQLRNLRVHPTSDDALVAFSQAPRRRALAHGPRRHHRRDRQPRPVERPRGLGRRWTCTRSGWTRAGPSSRTTCCPTRRTSGVVGLRPARPDDPRGARRPPGGAVTATPGTGRHAREPAPTTAQIVLPGRRQPAVPHPVETAGRLTERPASGTAPRCSTRSCSARSPTPRARAAATCAASSTGSTTCSGSASTACGCRRSTRARCATAATTSPTTPRSPASTAPWPTSPSSSSRCTPAGCASSSTW